ncbi:MULTISPECIES: response regulator transcription factor [Bacillaceae]|uniref:DNA-binding response regulator n=1 Tax=Gottfriedia luciferensis TaxID=178774 RepID=A0ABX2ZZT4_9BACI|nr:MULTISPECIES: response regulator transcription factor [Bacillaceae]ODG93914.1 DNA-binding response regulator [Gottfriedia luciferensis]SFC32093.1 DNA-binding response regulator, OmpR family, contains REC and winged-helix (wHTH) domain [Bacillus sp. UNCCL81]
MKKILIIEDDQSIALLQRDYLEINDFEVEIESNGKSGLQKALSKEYDLIILDLMLPELNGFEICKKIRESKDIPILIVSAKTEDIDKIRGFGLGADDFIVKPFSPSELIARVKAHLSRYQRLANKGQMNEEELQVRGLTIQKDSRKVLVNGEEKIFTTKEFNLLIFLASNPNKVFSKELLFDRIWGFETVGDISTVTVHIRKIREKIEVDPSNPNYIETIWGAGYRFKD